jgi:RNA polymerase primary sigma factor
MSRIMDTTATTATNNTAILTMLTNDIRRHKVFSAEEEIEKFDEFAHAEGAAKDAIRRQIANANLRFVLSVAKKYSNDGDTVAELVSEGTIGLYRAIDTFDVSKGFKFISHAVYWIRAAISEYYRSTESIVRRSNNAKIGSKDKAIREKFFQTEMREPSEQEIIDALESEYGITVKDKTDVVTIKKTRLDAKVSADDDATVAEVGEVATATAATNDYVRVAEKEDAEFRVNRLLSSLSVREQNIVCRKFGIGYDREYELEEIAEELGYTAERCRQILQDCLSKLRQKEKFYTAMAM